MSEAERTQKEVAEHLQVIYKHLRWAANHISAIYELTKPEEAKHIEDPNQLKMFEDECTGI